MSSCEDTQKGVQRDLVQGGSFTSSSEEREDDQLLPLSALQHLVFCERQCALIHIEGIWVENRLTAEGRVLHERAHAQSAELRGDVRISRSLLIRSLRLGLSGKADVLEFRRMTEEKAGQADTQGLKSGIALEDACGLWTPFPVEYKRGKPKRDVCDKVQLCAQALCLEEMLGVAVPAGALFYGATRRRIDVVFDKLLRQETEVCAERLHQLIESGLTPKAEIGPKCKSCSLVSECLPKAAAGRSVARYMNDMLSPKRNAEG